MEAMVGDSGAWPPVAPAYAALDLGTNNCRLLLAAPQGSGFRVLESFSRTVRLGEGLGCSGALSAAAMERALVALAACAARLGRHKLRGVRAIATEACRRAVNGAEFVARVRAETGLAIDIISAREEAELALESCTPLLGGLRRAVLFDIGGGSTEIVFVRVEKGGRAALVGFESLPFGVAGLAEMFGERAYTAAGFAAMQALVAEKLRRFEAVHCIGHEIRAGGVALMGTSGTVTTLAGVALGLPRYQRSAVDGVVLARQTALDAVGALRRCGADGIEGHPYVGLGRSDFVLPGCAIFAAIAELWPTPQVVVADRGLREGMLMRMMRAEMAGRRRGVGGR